MPDLKKKRIAIIGYGALGKALYADLLKAGFEILMVVSSNPAAPAGFLMDWQNPVLPAADLYWLCIPDDQISPFTEKIPDAVKKSGLWIHGSGALGLSVFSPAFQSVASVHFMQTFTDSVKEDLLFGVPASILAKREEDYQLLSELCISVGAKSFRVSESDKVKLHLAAVLVSNFWVILAAEANRILGDSSGISVSELFATLMKSTASNLEQAGKANPITVLSGPLRRGDLKTIDRHLNEMVHQPDLRELYLKMNKIGLNHLLAEKMDSDRHFYIKERLDGQE